MKTLDEVIKANECCNHGEPDSRCEGCPYNGMGVCCLERESDALHYLKEYHEYLNEEHCLAEEKKKIKQAYEQVYTQAKHDDEVSRRWEESYRQSQMPWNQGYCEMGG